MSWLRSGSVAGTILWLATTAPAGAVVVTGTFTGTVDNIEDSNGLLGLYTAAHGDPVVGSFSFNTAGIGAGGNGTNTGLTISVTDTTASEGTGASDQGDGTGLYGDGSFFAPASGYYYFGAEGGYDYLGLLGELQFYSPGLVAGAYDQSFTINPGSGSFGYIDADYDDGEADSGFSFFITSASMIGAPLPEPASLTVLGIGLLGLLGARRRRPCGAASATDSHRRA